MQIVMAHKCSKVKIDFELPRVKLQSNRYLKGSKNRFELAGFRVTGVSTE